MLGKAKLLHGGAMCNPNHSRLLCCMYPEVFSLISMSSAQTVFLLFYEGFAKNKVFIKKNIQSQIIKILPSSKTVASISNRITEYK